MKAGLRGIERSHEQRPQQLLRDTRTLGQRFVAFLENPEYTAIILVGLGTLAFVMPGFCDLVLLAVVYVFTFNYTRKSTLPFRMPMRSHALDYNDLKPGSSKPNVARGIAHLGNDLKTNEELWFTNEDMRTHLLIFGSTGSGKTEMLISLAYNALLQASGFIYVDGKGDNSLFSKIFSMARAMGREDDLLLINFMTGARDIIGPQEKRLSNTMNPFSVGSSSMLSQLVISQMDGSSNSPDGDMWKGRAIAFVEALMKILVYARDKEWILLDANTIRNYFDLYRLEAMYLDKSFLRDNQDPVSLVGAPDLVLEPIANYLKTLPGYDRGRKGKQVSQVLEQHGFITMQLTRVFTSLADTYGHILRTKLAEVDVRDVVLNRRVLVVLLPALEKSPTELSNLGKIIISSLKAMMASGLGEDVEGDYRDLIQRKPTNSNTPFICIMDEYGYYAVQGFAVVPAQARSLGFSAVFAGQDLPAFQKASKEEAASIGANTNIKVCMKLEDPTETWDFFTKTAGEAYVTKVDHFQTKPDSVFNSYLDTRSASFEKRHRIDILDLKDQRQGEYHIFFNSTIIRGRTFYANPKAAKKMRLNQFLKVEKPKTKELKDLERQFFKFKKCLEQSNYFENTIVYRDELTDFMEQYAQHPESDLVRRSAQCLMQFHEHYLSPSSAEENEIVDDPLPHNELNVFVPMRVRLGDHERFFGVDVNEFTQPFLYEKRLLELLKKLERFTVSREQAKYGISEELVKDMATATHYYAPPEEEQLTANEVKRTLNSLIERIQKARDRMPDGI